jgi:hypothetical protein
VEISVNDDDDNNSMEQSPSGESNSHAASQEIILCLLWKPMVHYRAQGPATDPYPETDESSPHPPTQFP